MPAYSDFDFSVTIFMITGSPGRTAIDNVIGPLEAAGEAALGTGVAPDAATAPTIASTTASGAMARRQR